MREAIRKNGFKWFVGLILAAILGTLLIYFLYIGFLAKTWPETNSKSDTLEEYPKDEAFLGTDNEDEIEHSAVLETEFEKLIYCAAKNESKPEFEDISVSDTKYGSMKTFFERSVLGNAYKPEEFRVTFISTKLHKDKGIVSFRVNCQKSSENDENGTVYKLFLEKKDGIWTAVNENLLP